MSVRTKFSPRSVWHCRRSRQEAFVGHDSTSTMLQISYRVSSAPKQGEDPSEVRNHYAAPSSRLSCKTPDHGDKHRKSQRETQKPFQELFMGAIDDKDFRSGRFGLPPLWRTNEDSCGDPSARRHQEDSGLSRPPFQIPADCPSYSRPRRRLSLVS
jgi:hypothetical protein